jgi:hypothetical protein
MTRKRGPICADFSEIFCFWEAKSVEKF